MSDVGHEGESVRTRGESSYEFDVTVLIATRDHADALARTLDSLTEQDLGGLSWEVVVIDNGSSDHTSSVLAKFARQLPLVIVHEEIPGKNRALNAGLGRARGELLVFTDDDVSTSPRWIQALVAAAARWPEDDIFGGSIRPVLPESKPSWLNGMDFVHTRWTFSGYHPRQTEGATSQTPLGPNLAIRSRALPVGSYDESIGPAGADYAMGSEVELLLRLYRGGSRFIFVPSATVEHILESGHVTRNGLNARAFRCGRGNARLFSAPSTFPVFGVPIYHVRRLAASSARLLTTLRGSEEERWIAGMEFHQARGNVSEQFVITRETRRGGSESARRLFPSGSAVLRELYKRGPWSVVTGMLGWLFHPLIRVQELRVFSAELGASTVEPALPEDTSICVYSGIEAARDVCVAICPLETLSAEQIEDRLAEGCSVAINFVDGRAVGYAWCTYRDIELTEIGRTLRVGPGDVVGFDGWVLPEWRGRGLLRALDRAQMTFAAASGQDRQLVYASGRNRSSIRSMARMGKQEILRWREVTVPPLGWSRRRASDDSLADALLGNETEA